MKRILVGLLVSLITLGLCALIAEYVIRNHWPQITRRMMASYFFNCFEKKNTYWLGMKLNAQCTLHSNLGAFPDLPFTTNSLGLRNPDITIPKPPGTIRIVFVGDSITFGWGMRDEDTYVRQTETLLKKQFPDKRIEAINAGVPATGLGYDYLFLKNIGVTLQPDLIVVGFYPFTDIPYDLPDRIWENLDAQGLPTKIESSSYLVSPAGMLRSKYLHWPLSDPTLGNSHFLVLLSSFFYKSPVTVDESDKLYSGICLYKSSCHDLDATIEKSYKLFHGMEAIAGETGAHLVIMKIPAEFVIYDGPIVSQKYAGIPSALLPWDKQTARVKFDAFFEQSNIDYLDLYPVYAEHQNEQTFFLADDHWNSRGHQITGEALAQKLAPFIEKL